MNNERCSLEEWQKRLGLQDWRIKLCNNCKPEEMTMPEDYCSHWGKNDG